MTQPDRLVREHDFWDHAVPTVDEVLFEYRRGPDPNTRLMLEAVRPGPGRRILDFACGGGVSSAWLASTGARVTAIDLSPASIAVAEQVALRAGLTVDFVCDDVERLQLPEGGFDAIVGRYALHHLDVARVSPILAHCVGPGGTGAFLETMGINPLLSVARRRLVGHFGVPRIGTLDEHPLILKDVALLGQAFGSVALATEDYHFLTMLDRQLLRWRSPPISSLLRWGDSMLKRSRRLRYWSFHQVVLLSRERIPEEELRRQMVTNVPHYFDRTAAPATF